MVFADTSSGEFIARQAPRNMESWKLLQQHSRESVATTPPVVTDQRFSRQPAVCLRTVSHVASAPNQARAQRGGRRVHTNSRNVQ